MEKRTELWLAIAGLASLSVESAAEISQIATPSTVHYCTNHEDGVTAAVFECTDCAPEGGSSAFFCADCDSFLHLPKARRGHARALVREKQAEMSIDVKDGTARVKLGFGRIVVSETEALNP